MKHIVTSENRTLDATQLCKSVCVCANASNDGHNGQVFMFTYGIAYVRCTRTRTQPPVYQ